MTGASPTGRQRELGKRLRDLHNAHDMTVDVVAGHLLCSATKISRLETGARRPSLRDVRDLRALYELEEAGSAELMNLARGHAAQDSNFILLEFDDKDLSPVVFVEGLTGNQYIERSTDIARTARQSNTCEIPP